MVRILINYFLILGSVLDLLLTYKFLSIHRDKFPDKDYTVIEANPIIRIAIRMKGLGEGMLISATIILFIMGVVVVVAPENFKFFLSGALYMMIVFHLINFLAMKRMKGVSKKL